MQVATTPERAPVKEPGEGVPASGPPGFLSFPFEITPQLTPELRAKMKGRGRPVARIVLEDDLFWRCWKANQEDVLDWGQRNLEYITLIALDFAEEDPSTCTRAFKCLQALPQRLSGFYIQEGWIAGHVVRAFDKGNKLFDPALTWSRLGSIILTMVMTGADAMGRAGVEWFPRLVGVLEFRGVQDLFVSLLTKPEVPQQFLKDMRDSIVGELEQVLRAKAPTRAFYDVLVIFHQHDEFKEAVVRPEFFRLLVASGTATKGPVHCAYWRAVHTLITVENGTAVLAVVGDLLAAMFAADRFASWIESGLIVMTALALTDYVHEMRKSGVPGLVGKLLSKMDDSSVLVNAVKNLVVTARDTPLGAPLREELRQRIEQMTWNNEPPRLCVLGLALSMRDDLGVRFGPALEGELARQADLLSKGKGDDAQFGGALPDPTQQAQTDPLAGMSPEQLMLLLRFLTQG